MAKIKLTKTELKKQTDALKRFQRFLPMLQLKKQQLQAEIAQIAANLEKVVERERIARQKLSSWVGLFSGDVNELKQLVKINRVETDSANIAGVTIPVFKSLDTSIEEYDLYATPVWYDDATQAMHELLSLKAERAVFAKQHELITAELTTTSQRVNLFEKVKIPECKENIRVIKISIGDEQTAAVTRGKLAKSRTKHAKVEDAA
ncbi:MAG: V-type ATP synthase subunit D [Kiritimatiellae bacterium]|nr:V-type ATP synthase subunit D [Kiritimatiellia bacterium]